MLKLTIERIEALPLQALQPLLLESLAQGYTFVERLVDEYRLGENRFDAPGEALFGVYDGPRLVAIGGLNRDPYLLDGQTGRVRHVYVLAAYRRIGAGRLLVSRIIDEARLHYKQLTLRTFSEDADGFYRALGFQPDSSVRDASHSMILC